MSTHVETKHEVVICLDCGVPLFQERGLDVKDWTLFCERCPQPSTTNEKTMPATKKPTHWTDIIPAGLPLARGVPVVSQSGACHVVMASQTEAVRGTLASKWRIDLDDPAGMGYALRLLAQHPEPASWSGAHGWVWRHLRGNTTDADRVDLAKALAEVMS